VGCWPGALRPGRWAAGLGQCPSLDHLDRGGNGIGAEVVGELEAFAPAVGGKVCLLQIARELRDSTPSVFAAGRAASERSSRKTYSFANG